jgi:hypothetical protein
VLLCLNPRWVVVKGRRLHVPLNSGSFRLFGSAMVCPDLVVLVSGSCPYDPGVAALLLPLLRRGARIAAAVPVAEGRGCPTDHSVLHRVPRARPDLAPARLRIRTAAAWAGVAGLVGRVAAIAGMDELSLCSTRGGLARCVNLLLCRRRSRRRGAVGAGLCTVT